MFASLFRMMFFKQVRDSAYAVWIVLFPPVLYVGLALIWPDLASGGRLLSTLALFLAATAGLMNQPLLYAQVREDGMLTRLSVTPLPESLVPLATALASLAISCAGQVFLVVPAVLWDHVPPDRVPAFLAASFSATTALVAAGLWIPVAFRGFLAVKNAGNLAVAALFAGAEIFFRLPPVFSFVRYADPLFWMHGGLRNAVSGSAGYEGLIISCAVLIAGGLLSHALRPRRVLV